MGVITFTDRLPDPNWTVDNTGAGHASSYTAGPGFKSIKFTSQAPVQVSRTNSGRVITRGLAGHKWGINITYNAMTRDNFEPIFSFLLHRKGRLNPFYIVLPNQSSSRNTSFASSNAVTNNTILAKGAHAAGLDYMLQDGHDASQSPRPGDMFTITDTDDSLHTKIYRVTRVTTSTDYISGQQPGANTERYIYFTPNLQRAVSDNSVINWTDPKIRVILNKDIQEYNLGTNNLYTFSLSLEEAQA